MTLELAARQRLLELALESIAAGFGRHAPSPLPPIALPAELDFPAASFVTLNLDEELRGCRGRLEPALPLAADVWENAWSSAFDDPRFPPLSPTEFPALDVEISLLSPLEPFAVTSESELLASLEPGVHGLVLGLGHRRATFLPKVWESLPEPHRFVGELKAKAGLPRDFWSPQISLQRYSTETFGLADVPIVLRRSRTPPGHERR
jgi:uncharacterized protein